MLDDHLICESRHDTKFHIRPTRQSGTALCGAIVANGTMIRLSAWKCEEGAGIEWCSRCNRRGKKLIGEAKFASAKALAATSTL
jgi:hypothetical protein